MRKFKMQQNLSKINGTITQKKVVSTSFMLVRDLKLKNSERFAQIQFYWRDFGRFCCIRFYDTSVVLNLGTYEFFCVFCSNPQRLIGICSLSANDWISLGECFIVNSGLSGLDLTTQKILLSNSGTEKRIHKIDDVHAG